MTNIKKFSVQSLINEAVKQDRKHYTQTSWHASSLGGCLTSSYLVRKGVVEKTFDDRTLRVFQAGRMFEDWLVGLLQKQDTRFETQVRCEWPERDLTGYADLAINGLVYEIKSKHSKSFWYMDKEGKPSRQHEYQLWAYLKCLGKPEGRLIYIEKDSLSIREFIVRLDDEELAAEVDGELRILNEAWKQGLPPEPIRDKKDWRYRYCEMHEEYCLKQPAYLEEKIKGRKSN